MKEYKLVNSMYLYIFLRTLIERELLYYPLAHISYYCTSLSIYKGTRSFVNQLEFTPIDIWVYT